MERKMRNFIKRPAVIIAIVVATLGVSGLATAYWTAAATTTTTASVAGGAGITLTATVPAGVAPGVDQLVTLKVTPTNNQSVYIGTVRLTGVSVDAGHSSCLTSWYSMADVVANETAPTGGAEFTLTDKGSLHMTETATNQDACKGATLTLTLAAW
jgi:hypothetical protein